MTKEEYDYELKCNEIKEILDNPKILMLSYGNYISLDDYVKLKDYITNLQAIEQQYSAILSENAELENKITNLQEENKRLEEIIENLTTMTVCGDKKQIKNTAQYKLDIYKSRCEKAVDLLKRDYWIKEYEHNDDVVDMALNILEGVDKE